MKSLRYVLLAAMCLPVVISLKSTGDNLCQQLQQMSRLCYGGCLDKGDEYHDDEYYYNEMSGAPDEERIDDLVKRVSTLEELLTWYKASNGRYYKVIEQLHTYGGAIAQCRGHKAILASAGVRDPDVIRELRNLVKQTGKDTWAGLNDFDQSGRYVWMDGVIAKEEDVIDWADGEPSDRSGGEDCVHFSSKHDWKLNDDVCTMRKYFLCEKLPEVEEPTTWKTASNGRSYRVFREPANYHTAKAKCQENGAILASYGVRDDNIRIKELHDIVRPANGYVWVGLNDIEREGEWVWEDGVVSESGEIGWAPGQPSNSYQGEDCVHFWPEGMLRLNDLPCHTKVYFLCEKTVISTSTNGPVETKTPPLRGGELWYIASNGLKYKVFTETANYYAAKAKCQDHGAILASAGVRDSDVTEELRGLVRGKGYVWVGLNDIHQEGRWVWEDGVISAQSDIDWAPAQPSNSYGGEDCVHFWPEHNLKFNDLPCNTNVNFLCEKP